MVEFFSDFCNSIIDYFEWIYKSFKEFWNELNLRLKLCFSVLIFLFIISFIIFPRTLLFSIILVITYSAYDLQKSCSIDNDEEQEGD